MLAIVTGTIKPNEHMKQLTLRDSQERCRQYEEALLQLIESKAFQKIVFCENSNYGVEQFQHLIEKAKENAVELETLSFQGNIGKACEHGKGYGEGEIMEYVFQHSQLLKSESYFVKITGRLMVDNITIIVSRLKRTRIYFNIPNRTQRGVYDTRIYAMPKKTFEEDFLEQYEKVMDSKGVYLEYVYTGILRENNYKVYNFPSYPRIRGISGSGGIIYDYTEWKCWIKDILSKISYYKVRK